MFYHNIYRLNLFWNNSVAVSTDKSIKVLNCNIFYEIMNDMVDGAQEASNPSRDLAGLGDGWMDE